MQMPARLRPVLARLLSPFIAALLMSLGARVGHEFDVEVINQTTLLVVDGVIWSVATLLALNGGIHKLINSVINPTDAAKPAVAEQSHATQ